MYNFRQYVQVETIEEAFELKKKRGNRIIAGGLWLRLGGNKNFNTAIDLSKLGLDTIEEKEDEFVIGCMTPLRKLETDKNFIQWFDAIPGNAVSSIVGTQFRNTATVGGSIYGRFGFSDVLTAFLALETYVEMHEGGMIPLEKFAKMPYDKDILVNLHVKKNKGHAAYESLRLTSTDFPIMTAAGSCIDGKWRIVVGARPKRARMIDATTILGKNPGEEEINKLLEEVQKMHFDSNKLASEEYRRAMADVLVKRVIRQILEAEK